MNDDGEVIAQQIEYTKQELKKRERQLQTRNIILLASSSKGIMQFYF